MLLMLRLKLEERIERLSTNYLRWMDDDVRGCESCGSSYVCEMSWLLGLA